MIERFNQTLSQMIRTHALENQDWDEDLDFLMAAYKSTIHPGTGFSPNFMMLGCEVYSPLELQFPLPRIEEQHSDQHEYALALQEKLENSYLEARRKLKKNSSKTETRL